MEEQQQIPPFFYKANIMYKYGRVLCPKCGNIIDPSDKSNGPYTVLEAIMKGHKLISVVVLCNACKSGIVILL
jgi:hypothetical protein